MTIRFVTSADAEAIARLTEQLGYSATPEAVRARLHAAAQGQQDVFVAEEEGRVAGWLHIVGCERLQSAPFAEIAGLVIDEAYRAQGVGTALIEAAEAWARQQGFSTVRVRSNVVRDSAHGFYERRGFQRTKTQHVFDKVLAGVPVTHEEVAA